MAFADHGEEENCTALEEYVHEREEDYKTSDVVEGLPSGGVLGRLSIPDAAHCEDPQDVKDDGHHVQGNQLQGC